MVKCVPIRRRRSGFADFRAYAQHPPDRALPQSPTGVSLLTKTATGFVQLMRTCAGTITAMANPAPTRSCGSVPPSLIASSPMYSCNAISVLRDAIAPGRKSRQFKACSWRVNWAYSAFLLSWPPFQAG